ncbi:fibronectin type III domain-containing protein [Mesomycoplasma molare]|uniref:Fibronectin type III domain-containing protein n=1 Tax=Mesomycoplasma molare TaxID=171288 RepID=A0ABY5TXL0_9BACT|nr:fibronectin type III domain-containing protein [Mesomycoplasma molare]UWD33968.1 fibronectin type III domain-containing protein [Mesomycoplasma molare]
MKKNKFLKPLIVSSVASLSGLMVLSCSKVEEKSDIVFSTTNLYSSSVILNFQAKEEKFSSEDYEYKFEYKKATDNDFKTANFDLIQRHSDKATVTLNNLTDSTKYVFKVFRKAKNDATSGEFKELIIAGATNDIAWFTTTAKPQISSAKFELTQGKEASSVDVTLNFSTPSDFKGKKIWVKLVEIEPKGIYKVVNDSIQEVSGLYTDENSSFKITIPGLLSQKTYAIQSLKFGDENSTLTSSTDLTYEDQNLNNHLTTKAYLSSFKRVPSSTVSTSDQSVKPLTINAETHSIIENEAYILTIREFDRKSGDFVKVSKDSGEEFIDYSVEATAQSDSLNRLYFVFSNIPQTGSDGQTARGKSYKVVSFVQKGKEGQENKELTIFKDFSKVIIIDEIV